MKIEIGESLGYSYLRHVKQCWTETFDPRATTIEMKVVNISSRKRKLRLWYLQVAANLARQEIVDLAVSGDGGGRTCFPVHEDAVTAALPE